MLSSAPECVSAPARPAPITPRSVPAGPWERVSIGISLPARRRRTWLRRPRHRRERQFLVEPTSSVGAGLAILRRGRFRLLAAGDLFRAEFRDASNQLHGDGLGQREADCALVDRVTCKLFLEGRDHPLSGGVDRLVLLPHSKVKQATTVQRVRGHLVRDDLPG